MARASVDFQFGEPQTQTAHERPDNRSWEMVILGDWTGRASRGEHAPQTVADRRVAPVDIDNFDELLGRWSPQLHIPMSSAGEGVGITIRSLDDFHPDSLFDGLELFASLRRSKRRLLDPAQFADESARWRPAREGGRPAAPTKAEATGYTRPANDADLLSEMLGSPAPATGSAATSERPAVKIAGIDLKRLIDEVVAPFVLPQTDPRQAEFVAAVDAAGAELLRRLLHDPSFQAVEAGWRQLWRVVKLLTGDGSVRLYLLDVTRAELAADGAVAGEDWQRSGLYRALVSHRAAIPGSEPWNTVVVLERFDRSAQDCKLLAALGSVASAAGGALLADVSPDVVGLPSWPEAADADDWKCEGSKSDEHWSALRASPIAAAIGLAAPRPLIRLPYGRVNSTTRLAFDELAGRPSHDALLWGSAALACAELIGLTVRNGGHIGTGEGAIYDLDDLPPATVEEDGYVRLQPSAEAFLSVSTGEALAARGVMPFLSYANRHAARLMSLNSLSAGGTRLY